jgi:endoglucanase
MKIINMLVFFGVVSLSAACGSGGGTKGSESVSSRVSSSTAISSASISSSVSSSSQSISISSSTQAVSYPSYNTSPLAADMTGMESNAVQLAAKMSLGWNIGNTLEAMGGKSETYWGNPKITEDYVKFVKQSGFNAIRLPVSWNQYANQTTAQIEIDWLNRVKEVVKYCIDNDIYVIVNIHWDGGWLENNVSTEKQAENNLKQKALWEQIATHLRDFDEHLMFASANEPSVTKGSSEQMDVLLSYHQAFIDAVRSTGGKNAYRVLIVQGPNTDVEITNQLMTKMPTDSASNRLMAEIHYYTPWNFTGMTKDEGWGNQFYYWGKNYHSTTDTVHNPTWGEEETVDEMFGLMKTQFVDKGIPLIVGEYGAQYRDKLTGDALTLHLASRAYFLKYVTQQALAKGLVPFYWDTGGVLSRNSNTVLDQQTLDALLEGGGKK